MNKQMLPPVLHVVGGWIFLSARTFLLPSSANRSLAQRRGSLNCSSGSVSGLPDPNLIN